MKPQRRAWMTHPWTILVVLSLMPAAIVAVFGLMVFLNAWSTGGPGRALPLALQFCTTPGILLAFAPPVLGALGYGVLSRWGSLPASARPPIGRWCGSRVWTGRTRARP